MLAEYLGRCVAASWDTVMPGALACRFFLGQEAGAYPRPLQPVLAPLHFEALFCQRGSITLTRRDGATLSAGTREILLLSDAGGITAARFDRPTAGVLVVVDARGAQQSLRNLCGLLGGLTLDTAQVRRRMAAAGGCTSLGAAAWSRAAFEYLDILPPDEQGRYCVLKSVELLYLLCMRQDEVQGKAFAESDRSQAGTLAMIRAYMEEHIDQKLTIPALSRRFYLAPTSLKAGFRRQYGQPVHTWLRCRRLERAAELLRSSELGVLEVAQAVGYNSASQFGAAFQRQYGVTPGQYRKMSETAES